MGAEDRFPLVKLSCDGGYQRVICINWVKHGNYKYNLDTQSVL